MSDLIEQKENPPKKKLKSKNKIKDEVGASFSSAKMKREPPNPPPEHLLTSEGRTARQFTYRRGKGGSVVWFFFSFPAGEKKFTICNLCNHLTTWDPVSNSTSNMLKHIRSKHADIMDKVKDQVLSATTISAITNTSHNSNIKLDDNAQIVNSSTSTNCTNNNNDNIEEKLQSTPQHAHHHLLPPPGICQV